MCERLVPVWIKLLPHRIDRLNIKLLEHMLKLVENHLEAVDHRLVGIVLGRGLQAHFIVVEHRKQLQQEVFIGALVELNAFALGTVAEIGKVGLQANKLVAQRFLLLFGHRRCFLIFDDFRIGKRFRFGSFFIRQFLFRENVFVGYMLLLGIFLSHIKNPFPRTGGFRVHRVWKNTRSCRGVNRSIHRHTLCEKPLDILCTPKLNTFLLNMSGSAGPPMDNTDFRGNEMKWIWTLLLAAMTTSAVCAKERLNFPFDQATRITFIRLGNLSADAGQQFALTVKQGQWSIERRISRSHASFEDIPPEQAREILAAFSELYSYWQDAPYREASRNGYSLYISINDTWQMSMRVKDRGSPELKRLIQLIEYPEGLVLKEVKEDEISDIRAASESGAQP